jgi:hypothetical protein
MNDIEGELKKSSMIINILNKRIVLDRTILYLIIIVLFILNILVLYIKL